MEKKRTSTPTLQKLSPGCTPGEKKEKNNVSAVATMKNLSPETLTMKIPSDVMMEEREELMISPISGSLPTLRIAHFLSPSISPSSSVSSPNTHCAPSSKPTFFDPTKTQLRILFSSHKYPIPHWNDWVARLRPIYQHIWIQAGIHDAIVSSTRKIHKDNSMIMCLAERWNFDTNTFVFPWGEATLTLEDMVVLGGYSVLGDSVLSPLASLESAEICSGLQKAHKEIRSATKNVQQKPWMDYFRATGSKLEHEAFLVLWLSRFVFSQHHNYIPLALFPIAIHLSKGIKIALAPAVLASIYRDFRLLKRLIINSCTSPNDNGTKSDIETPLFSPLQLVLLWVRKWFCGEPRLGIQQGLPKLDFMNVRESLDLAGECFLWRPYGIDSSNSLFRKLYKDNGEWVLVEANMGEELESYARCLRVSALVGLDCIEEYFPHRVSMQFGFDQDVPGHVTSSNVNAYDAWRNYERPVIDVRLYIPPRLFASDVTLRYVEWLKGSVTMADSSKGLNAARKKRSTNHRRIPRISWGGGKHCPQLVLPVSLTTCHREEAEDYIDEDEMMIADLIRHKSENVSSRDTLCYVDELLLKPHTESASFSVANDIDIRQIESTMEPVKLGVLSAGKTKSRMEETDVSEPKDALSVGKVKRGMEEADLNEQKDSLASIGNNEERTSWDDTIELPELDDLEVRVSRLEKVFAALKAAKLKGKLQKNP